MSITSQLHKQKIAYEIVEAIDGQSLSPEKNSEIDWEYAHKNASWISKGLLACSLSHLKAYRSIVDQGLPFGLVLEDDTVLGPGVAALLETVEGKLLQNEVLLLYYASWEKCALTTTDSVDTGIGRHKIVRPLNPTQLVSANAYLITNEACRKILAFQNPLQTTSDFWGVYFNHRAVENLRCVYPMMADTGDFKSNIDYVRQDSVKAVFLNVINTYRIFPLFQLLKWRRKKQRTAMLNFELVEHR